MDTYTFSLVLGGAGLVAMAAAGAAHIGGGHVRGAGHSGPHGHGAHAHQNAHPTQNSPNVRDTLLSLISPRVLFGALLGFGVTGILLHSIVPSLLLPLAAIGGAVIVEGAIMGPLWRFFLRFASRPAQTFDASIMSEARAASGFNAQGEGLVAVEVDGQIVQCLGQLRPEDRALGVRVRAGDVLRVETVDAARQRCTVSYVRHALAAE